MRIVIADDHPLLREAIRATVEHVWPDRDIVEAGSAAAARAEADKGAVELMTLDLHMADSSGLQMLMELRQDFPAMPVVIVSASEDPRIQRGAKELGASGFVPKSASLTEMREAFHAIAEGNLWFPTSADGEHEEVEADDSITRLARLTPAQRRILKLAAEGRLNKQIAHEMGISEATVKAHMTAIFRRLGVINRTQAVLLATHLDDAAPG
ncbi:MAG: response regulator transcription factor [Sphingomonadaceae bacterium]|nr:response regulator transcription factor [Sphingomonadaceae bacterium]